MLRGSLPSLFEQLRTSAIQVVDHENTQDHLKTKCFHVCFYIVFIYDTFLYLTQNPEIVVLEIAPDIGHVCLAEKVQFRCLSTLFFFGQANSLYVLSLLFSS